jgi:hypothetical protein
MIQIILSRRTLLYIWKDANDCSDGLRAGAKQIEHFG